MKKRSERSDKGGVHAKAKPGDVRLGNKFSALRTNYDWCWIFNDPKELWDKFIDYMEWCELHPIKKNDTIKAGPHAGTTFPVEMPRCYTMTGFASYLGITSRALYDYGNKENHKKFHDIYFKIQDIMDSNRIENGLVGNYDPRLVATLQGLRNKQELTIVPQLNFDATDKNI